jgi:hypothetical protein
MDEKDVGEKDIIDKTFGSSRNLHPMTEPHPLVGKSFAVEWCETCGAIFVKCPRCGNNSCNGGYGEDGKCPVCPLAYELMFAIEKNVDKIKAKPEENCREGERKA